MRLKELTGYKKNPGYQQLTKTKKIDADDYRKYPDAEGVSDSFDEFIEMAKDSGWIYKGKGYYGQVLHKPGSSYVYKIYYDDDQAYRKFVDWARRNQKNPYLPKLGPAKMIPKTEGIYITKIEWLSPPSGPFDPRFKKYVDEPTVQSFFSSKKMDSYDWSEFDKAVATLRTTEKQFSSIIDFAEKNGTLDLHFNNVMFRKDQLVVIDPIT